MATSETEVAARLIERLLADPDLRARFRRDPAAACLEAGLPELAEEMALGAGKAMMTLDVRESRSSLAGVMMAAAMEGVGLYHLSQNVLPHLDDVPPSVGAVLSRVNLPSVRGALAAEPPNAARAAAEPGPPPESAAAGGAPPEAAAAAAASPEEAAVAGSPRDRRAPAAVEKIADDSKDLPDGNDFPDGATEPKPAEYVGSGAKPAPQEVATPAQPAAAAVAPEAVPVRSGGRVDPGQFGAEGTGTGGPPSPEGLALLKNDRVVLDEVGVADIKAGRIDPRVIAVLTKLSREHEITVSCMCSDHSKFTSGGSISNHHYGRGLDIAAIDGAPVNASNFDAREIATELQDLDPAIRPSEIGTPWAIAGPGYFTDAGHQDHLHIGFDQPITPTWTPPTDLTATTTPDPTAAAAGQPAAPVAVGQPGGPAAETPPPRKPGDSLVFAAVPSSDRAAAGADHAAAATAGSDPAAVAGADQAAGTAGNEGGRRPGGSLSFLPAVDQPAAASAPPEAAAALAGQITGPSVYPGDDAPREQLAAWMAHQAQKRGLPPELPVMAALVESNLQNLNYGDADSVGFFQMRLSYWNRPPYTGFPDNPQKQIDWFLDTAEHVKAQRQATGQPTDDPNHYGDWIADIERPAAQYRGRYQPKLTDAQTLLKTAGNTPPAEAAVETVPAGSTGGAGPKALAALAEAKRYMGTPYQWGGSTPETGFDCSGLVQWAYAQSGIQIPRVTDQQILAANGTEVGRDELLPGDLVFFRDSSGYVHHVGMSLGGDRFVHAPHTGDVVKISSLDEPYYAEQFAGGRRFDQATAAAPVAAPTPVVDPTEVARAQAAVARDAAEVRRSDSLLFKAITKQETAKRHATVQFLKAIDPAQAGAARSGAPGAAGSGTPAAAPGAPAAPAGPPEAVAAQGNPPDLSGVGGDYPGDDASQAELAKWLAKRAKRAGLPPELPVMAALVESGVKNLNYGDADSVGFFQMRVGIWNQGEYAGYPERPELQAKWFIDTALAVKKQRIAAGDVDFGKDPTKWGEWIADVERPAAQYRGRYQLRLSEARRLLA